MLAAAPHSLSAPRRLCSSQRLCPPVLNSMWRDRARRISGQIPLDWSILANCKPASSTLFSCRSGQRQTCCFGFFRQNGQMTHAVFANSVDGIPYTVRFAGRSRTLSGRPMEVSGAVNRRQVGRVANYPLTFEITDASDRVAGIYKDTVTITVEPR